MVSRDISWLDYLSILSARSRKEPIMKWYIIRHADKEIGDFPNPTLPLPDEPISAKGQAQARALLAYFADRQADRIFISQYIRTRQTIGFVADRIKIAPVPDGRLNEINNGKIVGLSDQEIQQQYPEMWSAYQARDRDFHFPDGESGEDVRQRIQSFFQEHEQNREDLILVAHDGWIRVLMCHILGIPVHRRWDFRVDFCGISEIEYQPVYKRWRLNRFNHICGVNGV
jgi:broad specificity phosphatase PhoE